MSAKQTINDKLQGSVATYLMWGGVVNNQIKKGLLLSMWVKKIKISEYLAKLQTRTWLSRALCVPGQHTARRRRKCPRQSRFWLQLRQIFTDLKITDRLRNLAVRKAFWNGYDSTELRSWVCGSLFWPTLYMYTVHSRVGSCWVRCQKFLITGKRKHRRAVAKRAPVRSKNEKVKVKVNGV